MANLLHTNPLNELSAYREALHQLIDAGWFGAHDLLPAALAMVLVPVDVIDTDDALVVRANMPGVSTEELKITLNGRSLTLKGETKDEGVLENPHFIRRERRMALVSRTVDLPVEVDADNAQAYFHDGVLTLTLPKNEKVRPRRIKIFPEVMNPVPPKEKG